MDRVLEQEEYLTPLIYPEVPLSEELPFLVENGNGRWWELTLAVRGAGMMDASVPKSRESTL